MDFVGVEWIWKSALIVIGGIILLRLAGRKSISQMTLAQTVIMIGIGSLLIQPLAGENIWSTLYVGFLLVLTLIIVEYGQLKFDFIEQLVTGNSKVLIKDGHLKLHNLRSVRLTVDQLETQLRLNNIMKIKDVKWATIEPNGQIAYVLKDDISPATKQDVNKIAKELTQLKELLKQPSPSDAEQLKGYNESQENLTLEKLSKEITDLKAQLGKSANVEDQNIFEEVDSESHNVTPPKHLQ
nr:YetF domain-containing protein [Evansella cellulosilytica]